MPHGASPGERRGGRAKGTLNRATIDLQQRLAALNCDPLRAMAEIVIDKKSSPDLRLRAASELCQYIHPKRRAIEVDATVKVTDDRSYDQLVLDAVRTAARLGVAVPAQLQAPPLRVIDADAND